ncbi:MAG: ABC transporter permease [Clostridiales bacterium]|nr:ABC transporter permease [Clostridiales bacterium]
MKRKLNWESIVRSKVFWAVVAEALILLIAVIVRPDFLKIEYNEVTGMLYGVPIDILNRSAEIIIIAMGMTLVIALGGTDLSVGALVAVSGALALKFLRWDVLIYNTPGNYTVMPFYLVILVPLVACTLMGAFNGLLISRLKLQPIIATLILMVAGRGIAQIATNGKQFTTMYTPYQFIAQGHVLWLPLPIIIAAVVLISIALFTRKTSFGMFVESVGVNPNASRVSGLKSNRIIMIAYMLTGFLSGIAGLIYSSRISSCDSNNAGVNNEMDAILAVVIGGTSMSGGKFSLAGTVVGALIMRTIITLVYFFGIVSEAILAFEAVIIAVVIVLQSEPVRKAMAKRGHKKVTGGVVRA